MVSPDTIRTAIGVIGNGTALVLFLSPVPTFIRIWKKGSVEQYSPIPYVATLLNCMMWVLYGLPVVHPHSMLVITINGTGMAIQLTYVTLFLLYSAGAVRRKVVLLLAAEVAFVGAVAALVLTLAHTHERRSMLVGILCVLFGTGMYAAPLSVMKMVIQTKSVEYMPLFLSLASLVNGICWTAYALIHFDLYITEYFPHYFGTEHILEAPTRSTLCAASGRQRQACTQTQTQPPPSQSHRHAVVATVGKRWHGQRDRTSWYRREAKVGTDREAEGKPVNDE